MKTRFFYLTLFLLVAGIFTSKVQAQEVAGTKYLNAGVGIGSFNAGGIPLGVSFEYGLKNNISVGAFFDYARYGENYAGYKWHYTFLYFGGRASYHANELFGISNEKLDVYGGLSLGFRSVSYKDNSGYYNDYYSPYNSSLILGLHAGARYMLSEKVGGFAEVGYGVAALRLGVTAKF
ncbi:hypothetical protein [Xanthocytophaga agilis]|uniref:Outer membrane protein beta-barrel domain-containing protein n=1 Tax=Xanthocytophaga agilis TaxID=3048010 RepID=A0AAE3R1G5_9BACT|nr:hypothetical protein [Xanthocytophaga agilis]MDJ1501365.1 hypothetical protein [Xanthocytophaga agilis]